MECYNQVQAHLLDSIREQRGIVSHQTPTLLNQKGQLAGTPWQGIKRRKGSELVRIALVLPASTITIPIQMYFNRLLPLLPQTIINMWLQYSERGMTLALLHMLLGQRILNSQATPTLRRVTTSNRGFSKLLRLFSQFMD